MLRIFENLSFFLIARVLPYRMTNFEAIPNLQSYLFDFLKRE